MEFQNETIAGWGLFPMEEAHLYRPESLRDIEEILTSEKDDTYIARGLGRSYGDTALNFASGVILQERMNSFLSFDENTGIVECEAGVSFEELISVLLPRGYFLPVTPGTKFVTVGGAIANDVHGKNHHQDGCISDHLIDFTLLTASMELLRCSRTENSELFWATIGGIGLTGIIIRARIQMIPITSSYLEVDYKKARNLEEALSFFSEDDENYQYSVAWIDCLAKGNQLGRSVLMRGNHLSQEKAKERYPLIVIDKRKLAIPFHFPSFVLNKLSIQAFNGVYYRLFKHGSTKIVDYDSFFYPLDSINHWNRMYGKKGFVQYQVVFPKETSREGLTYLLERLSESGRSSFLAVLKSFGEQNGGLLSFPFAGYTLALDIPVKDRQLLRLLSELDSFVVRLGGRLYTAKDATTTPSLFREMYPKLEQFKEVKRNVDPFGRFSSSMARRLQIVGDKR